jgi:hypothetical protein
MYSYSIRTSLLSDLSESSPILVSPPSPSSSTHLLVQSPDRSNGYRQARRSLDSWPGRFSIRSCVENSLNLTIALTLNHLEFGYATDTRGGLIPSASSPTECGRLSVGPVPHVPSRKVNATFVCRAALAVSNATSNALMQTSH